MKKPILYISLLAIMFFVWKEWQQEEVQTPPPSIDKSEPPKPPPRNPPQVKTEHLPNPVGHLMTPTTPSAEGRPAPPPNSVPFKLYQGLVVAYGDQLLGQPTTPDFPEEGFIDAPKVNYWPKAEVPYSIDPKLTNPDRVERVIAYFNENTPIRFVPFSNQKDSLVFTASEVPLCLSYVGKIGGHQPVYLDDRCFDKEIIHELMHALGFVHEQSRPDRDRFIKIHWDRIEADKQSQFEIAPTSMTSIYKNRPFDYQSVMIYDPADFAKVRGDFTMESLTENKIEPTANGLSPEDLARLKILAPAF